MNNSERPFWRIFHPALFPLFIVWPGESEVFRSIECVLSSNREQVSRGAGKKESGANYVMLCYVLLLHKQMLAKRKRPKRNFAKKEQLCSAPDISFLLSRSQRSSLSHTVAKNIQNTRCLADIKGIKKDREEEIKCYFGCLYNPASFWWFKFSFQLLILRTYKIMLKMETIWLLQNLIELVL